MLQLFKLKKFSVYQIFPVISVICLILAKFYEDNYHKMPNSFFEYVYFNILYQGALLFFIAYLIPLVLLLKVGENIRRKVTIVLVFMIIFYILTSAYLFFFKNTFILSNNYYDFILGTLIGFLLGVLDASSYKKIDIKEKKI